MKTVEERPEEKVSAIGRILEKALELDVPVNALFELTYRCNLKCGHCYLADPGGRELGTAQAKQVLDQLADAGTLFLTLSGGEVLLRKDWPEIARYAREKNFALRIFSNGTLIDAETARLIADIGVIDVGLSLYGATAESHEQVTGVPGSFDRTLAGLEALHEQGLRTVCKFLLMRHNVDEYAAAKALAEDRGSRFSFSFMIGPRLDGTTENCGWRMDEAGFRKALEAGFLYPDTTRVPMEDRADMRDQTLSRVPMCGAGHDNCSVSPYGDVFPCATLPIKVGNILETPFSDIWRDSPKLVELRRAHMSDIEECRDCRSVGYCGRCPGFAMLEDGDVFGPSSFACKVDRIGNQIEEATA